MNRNRELRQWIEYLNRAELPVFANTARRLVAMSSDSDCSAQDLAAIILNDSAMTAKVLRLASSVIYNPGGNRIDTVSYAIMLLGFTLDELTLALAEEWNLGDVVVAALTGKGSGLAHAPIVRLAHDIAETIAKGWHTPKLKNLVGDYAGVAHVRSDKAEQCLQDGAAIAEKNCTNAVSAMSPQ